MAAGTLDNEGLQKTFSTNPEAVRYENTYILKDMIQQLTGKEASASDINNYLPKLLDGTLGPATLFSEVYNSPASKQYQLTNMIPKEYGPRSAAESQKTVPQDSATLQDFFGSIEKASGLPTGILLASMGVESTFGQRQQGSVPQYKGAFQMGNAERKNNGVINPWNWQQSAVGAAKYMLKNAEQFKEKTGRAPTFGDYYGMHLQGANGWSKVVNNPNGLATKTLGYQKVKQNIPGDIKVDLKTLTNQQFREIFDQKILNNLVGPDKKGLDVLNLNPDGTTKRAPGTPVTPGKPGDQGSNEIYDQIKNAYDTNKTAYDSYMNSYNQWKTAADIARTQEFVNSKGKSNALPPWWPAPPAPPEGLVVPGNVPTLEGVQKSIASQLAQQGAGGNVWTNSPVGITAQPINYAGVIGNEALAASLGQQSSAQQAAYLAQEAQFNKDRQALSDSMGGALIGHHQSALQNYLTETGSAGLSYLMGFGPPPTDRMGRTVIPPAGYGVSYGGGGGGSGSGGSGSTGVGSGNFGLVFMNKGGAVKHKKALNLTRRLLEE
jgi:hypothetical protein